MELIIDVRISLYSDKAQPE